MYMTTWTKQLKQAPKNAATDQCVYEIHSITYIGSTVLVHVRPPERASENNLGDSFDRSTLHVAGVYFENQKCVLNV